MELEKAKEILTGIGVDWDKFKENWEEINLRVHGNVAMRGETIEGFFNGTPMHSWLHGAFVWEESPEGYKYWSDLNLKLQKYIEGGIPSGSLD
jgi:hypothetical protein